MTRYLLYIIFFTSGICGAVAWFNYQVDPYVMYHYADASDERLNRTNQFWSFRVTKPWHMLTLKPTSIVLGTSRTAVIRPSAFWPKESSYNLSVPGMTVYEMERFIELAQATGPLKSLLIGVDFEAFIRNENKTAKGFEEARMARRSEDLNSAPFLLQRAKDAADSLFSLPSFVRSLSAFTGSAKLTRRYYKDGTWQITSDFFTGRQGFQYIGDSTILAISKEQLSLDANMQNFADILRFVHEENIDTKIFITPEHVFLIDLWARLGYGDMWGDFHHRLIEVNQSVAKEMNTHPFPIYAYNNLPNIVDEPIVGARDAKNSFFTDGVHPRQALGDKMSASVWSQKGDFGTPLTAQNVEAYLKSVDSLRRGFENSYSESNSRLRRAITSAGAQ